MTNHCWEDKQMPTTPLAHQQYDILPMCHKIGGEGYSYKNTFDLSFHKRPYAI